MNRLSSLRRAPSANHVEPVAARPSVPEAGMPSSPWEAASSIGRPRRFFLPARYEPNYRYPLIIWLHNNGHNENQISQVLPHISLQNYVGVGIRGSHSADTVGHRFDWSGRPAAVARCEEAVWQAIDDASSRYSINPERVFLAGYGAGGTMACRVALQHPRAFAGCISLGGRLPRGGRVLSNLSQARNLRTLWAVGTENRSISQADFEDDIALAASARLRLDVRRYTVDDEMVHEILRDVDAWIMSRVTGSDSQPPAPDWQTVEVGFSSN